MQVSAVCLTSILSEGAPTLLVKLSEMRFVLGVYDIDAVSIQYDDVRQVGGSVTNAKRRRIARSIDAMLRSAVFMVARM